MKTYKTIQKEVKVVDQHTCDVCGKDIHTLRGFKRDYATVEGGVGDCYPEVDCRRHYKVDMCGECFEKKLIPLMEKEFGITIDEIDDEE